jgi:hypothetical protein
MKKIYYTIEKDYECGFKTINLYSIENNELITVGDIETNIENISISEIQRYLDNNGMGDEEFEFVLL